MSKMGLVMRSGDTTPKIKSFSLCFVTCDKTEFPQIARKQQLESKMDHGKWLWLHDLEC